MENSFNMDWGSVSPDGHNKDLNSSLYVLNFYMVTEEARAMAQKYTVGKILWHLKHLPENCKFQLRLDIRGQSEIKYEFDLMREWKAAVINAVHKTSPNTAIYMDIIA